ncbi:hypothetical protein DPMN_060880 [Dreissena polymorpha]|uniref:Uncharacterized protein n=1 Tax=Dreissena polymorpha TaxID=45954 RepID=A0A9D4C6Q2_DREPO|nr:hypothetical protein DPMN_060880 [Dreissena polymorpha]
MALQRTTRAPRVGNEAMHDKVQYQLEVNRLKGNFGWAWAMWTGRPWINRIVIREVQCQFEVNRCRNEEVIVKGNFGWAWPMWAGRLRIDHIVIREVQYQFEVNRCRNEETIVKGNFGWAWPMWAGRPRINCIVIREVQHRFEVNWCRNEEIIVKGNFRWAPCIAEIDRIVTGEVQYQFEVNRCGNEEIIVKGNFGWAWPMWAGCPRIDRIVIKESQFQGFSLNRRTDGRTDAHHTISPLFLRKTWG